MTVLLFTGDSVTDCDRRTSADGLGTGYVKLLADQLGGQTVLNTGISGHRVVDLEARWQEDVLEHDPGTVTILIGVNDTWRRYDADDPTSTEDFAAGYRRLLERTAGRSLVLMEPFLLPVRDEQQWREDLDPKIDVVRTLAREYGATLVPLDTALAAHPSPAEALAADGVHPTALGHEVIAAEWRRATGL